MDEFMDEKVDEYIQTTLITYRSWPTEKKALALFHKKFCWNEDLECGLGSRIHVSERGTHCT